MFKVNKKDTSKTAINCSSTLVNKFEQMLHFVLVFLLPFWSSKKLSNEVLAVFQGRYPRVIIMQPVRQMQWLATKATSENLIFCTIRTNGKGYSLLHNYFCMLAALFEVENK